MRLDQVVPLICSHAPAAGHLTTPLAETGLHAWYVFERAGAFTPLMAHHLEVLQVHPDRLHPIAIDNLWDRLGALTFHRYSSLEPYHVIGGNPLLASSVLLPEVWRLMATEVAGELVGRVHNSHWITFAGAGEAPAIEHQRLAGDGLSLLAVDAEVPPRPRFGLEELGIFAA
ncbi:MAG: hypothetical protein ACI9MR_001260 [Myxococcota bacterium]|jgi:hypothetical protein